jgi:hypothetical protein
MGDAVMMNQAAVWDYNKGHMCKYASVLCQEGYCLRCGIYARATQKGLPKKPRGASRSDYIHNSRRGVSRDASN